MVPDRDPDSVLENFSDELNDRVLFVAAHDWMILTGSLSIEAQIFQIRYFAKYPEKLSDIGKNSMLKAINDTFPDFSNMDREDQKETGLKLMNKMKDHPGLKSSDPVGTDLYPEVWTRV